MIHLDTSFLVDLLRERKRVGELVRCLHVVYPAEGFAVAYGKLLADLRRSGASIAAVDLLIATAAVRCEAALVTRNVRHLSPIPGLELIEY